MTAITIGIDPGLTGAVAAVNSMGILVGVWDMPTMASGKGGAKVKQVVNAAALASLLNRFNGGGCQVLLERVSSMPGQGVASMFSMGDTFGSIRSTCLALELPVEIITPQTWKKYYNLPSDKEICRARAIQLYPEAPLARKKDHNRAEAILIARYGMRGRA